MGSKYESAAWNPKNRDEQKLQTFPRGHCDGKVLPKPLWEYPQEGFMHQKQKLQQSYYSQYFINIVILNGV